MLTGTRDDDDVMPAGSLHAHAHACWIPTCPPNPCTCPCLCPLDPRTPMSMPDGSTHTRTGAPCVFTRRVPTQACSQGPHACSLTGSPCVLARRVSIHAHTGPMHMRSHRVSTRARSQGPHAHVYVSAGCIMCASSAVCIGRVICSSSSTVL